SFTHSYTTKCCPLRASFNSSIFNPSPLQSFSQHLLQILDADPRAFNGRYGEEFLLDVVVLHARLIGLIEDPFEIDRAVANFRVAGRYFLVPVFDMPLL